jgi:hypothetical protein
VGRRKSGRQRLRLRGELAIHLASIAAETDGRVVIMRFVDKMEGMSIGARQAHCAFGNQTLVRYLRARRLATSWIARYKVL